MLTDENFGKLVAGKSKAQTLFMSGKLKVKGNVMKGVHKSFVKASGDPLEWRRFFKRMAVLCQDAVFRPEV